MMRLTDLRHAKVRTLDGEKLGRVFEVHCDSGQITALSCGAGGFIERLTGKRAGLTHRLGVCALGRPKGHRDRSGSPAACWCAQPRRKESISELIYPAAEGSACRTPSRITSARMATRRVRAALHA